MAPLERPFFGGRCRSQRVSPSRTISLKVDSELAARLSAMPNRSEFIRGALRRAFAQATVTEAARTETSVVAEPTNETQEFTFQDDRS